MRMFIMNDCNTSINYKVIATRKDGQELANDSVADDEMVSKASVYEGVSWNRVDQQCEVFIKQNGQKQALGLFDNEYEAAMDYDKEAHHYRKPKNFPFFKNTKKSKKKRTCHHLDSIEQIDRQEIVQGDRNKNIQQWCELTNIDGKMNYLECFDSEYDAAIRYDEERIIHKQTVNVSYRSDDIVVEKQKKQKVSSNEQIEMQGTKYVGINWCKISQRWKASISLNGKQKYLGYFHSENDAAMAYDKEARKQGRSVNFPIYTSDIQAKKKNKDRLKIEQQETEYVGVSWNKNNQRWHSQIQIGKRIKYLGCFENDYDAAMRYDEEAKKYKKSVNFPIHPEDVQAEKPKKQRKLSSKERIENQETEYVGVSWNKLKQRWTANIQIKGKRISLGVFDSDYDAAMKYDEEAKKHKKSVNFPIHSTDTQVKKRKKNRKISDIERIERQETKYVGVSWKNRKQRWEVKIKIDGKMIYLGSFDSDHNAAMVYDKEARKHGKPVNFPNNPADVQVKKRKKS